MDDAPILDLDPAEEAEVEQQVLGIFADDALDLLEDIIKDDLGGLFLKLCQLGDRRGVQLDGGEERSILSSISMLLFIRNFSMKQRITCLPPSSAACELSCTKSPQAYSSQKQG